MSRRVSLLGADDLFRPTVVPDPDDDAATSQSSGEEPGAAEGDIDPVEPPSGRAPSGRVRHDEKMTVYVTSDELLDLEHARLLLRRHHSLAVDRGRLVREAVAEMLLDLDERGRDSVVVKRLRPS